MPSQLHRFIELIKEQNVDLSGKYAAQITTSKHFYDVTAHRFIQDNCDDMELRYLGGLSADMEDLLHEKGQKEAEAFFRFALWRMEHGYCEPRITQYGGVSEPASHVSASEHSEDTASADRERRPGKIAVVADFTAGSPLEGMAEAFCRAVPYETEIVNLSEFHFTGGCLGCFHCASDGTCVYKDGFDTLLRERIQTADAIVYAYTVRDHSMGSRFKMFDDRQFCNGHRTVTMGKPVAYLVDGDLSREANLMMLMEARAQVGGNYLAGIAASCEDIGRVADTLCYAIEHDYQQPKNFYGVGGMKIFRDLIYQMQGLMREDHRFYKKNGFYDFPQKKKAQVAAMYAVGAMMQNKKLQKKIGVKMTGGMVMPYQAVLKAAGKRAVKRPSLIGRVRQKPKK